LLQERFDKIKNPTTGALDLLSPTNQAALDQQFLQRSDDHKRAAVLVLLLSDEDGAPSLLLTRRAAHLSQHAAEISFPGGHHDGLADGDSLVDTAVREAVEELFGGASAAAALQNNNNNNNNTSMLQQDFRNRLSVLGTTSPLPSIRGVPVTPVIAALLDYDSSNNDSIASQFPGDGGHEVDLVFSASLQELLRVETTHTLPATRFNFQNNRAPCFPIPIISQPQQEEPNNDNSNSNNNIHKIWGLTAYILRPVLHKLLKPVFFGK